MKPLTVKDLYSECKKQIVKGNGDKIIMISDDDEGNGFHYLWYSLTEYTDDYEGIVCFSEDISNKDNTMLLG